ncbi:ABC transporter ATP-binding protein [uncultured Fibrobacter sp.]|uniref:ABC transporter ATP-binding protein n=1 Tax=uncultured Fibrobacter sp. TaxID=261512 RepID=UPI002804D492|nr:ABC transporter ATP-binding protein [uncultured Fibrobacter sp.]
MAETVLEAKNLSVGYGMPLFPQASLDLQAGELVSLVGPNGSGKSTLLKTFAGLLTPCSGTIRLCGMVMEKMAKRKRAQLVASVFTHERAPFGMTVREFISLGRIPFSGIFDQRTEEDESAVDDALANTELTDFANRRVAALSDGERSRVLVARAMASHPKLLLLDEPTAFLDVPHILSLFHFLREFAEKKQMAILLSTHHLDYAFRFSHRVIALDGKGGIGEGFLPKMQEAGLLSWAKE